MDEEIRASDDRSHGSARESYEAARRWRDRLIARLQREASAARVCQRSSRNSSGVVGVSKVAVSASNGETYYFWQATWCPQPGEG